MCCSEKNKIITIAFLLMLAVCFSYGTSLQNGFLMDDNLVVRQNTLIRNFSFFPQWFSQPFLKYYYRPVAQFSFSLDYLIWELNPFGFHLTSICLHFINAAFLFFLLYILFKDFTLSALTAFLFAVHPITSISVNYVADRGSLLAALFMLGALLVFCKAHKRSDSRFYLIGFLLFICALLSHESTILFPLYLLCVLYGFSERSDFRKIRIVTGVTFLISSVYFLLRTRFLNFGIPIFSDLKLTEYLYNFKHFFYLIYKYASLIIFPRNICLIREISPGWVLDWKGGVFVFLVACFITMVIIKLHKKKILLIFSIWFLIGLFPLYFLMFSRPEMGLIMQDNWVYFPSIGLFIILSQFFIGLKKFINVKLWLFMLVMLIAYYINSNRINNALWKDEKTYCSYWLKLTSRNPFAFNSLGSIYGELGDYKKARDYFMKGMNCFIKSDGKSVNTLITGQLLGIIFNNLGVLSSKEGKTEEAIIYYQNAIEVDSNNSDAHFGLGNLYLRNNDLEAAILHYKESIKINFYRLDAHRKLAELYAARGDKNMALKEVKIAISIDPGSFKTSDVVKDIR